MKCPLLTAPSKGPLLRAPSRGEAERLWVIFLFSVFFFVVGLGGPPDSLLTVPLLSAPFQGHPIRGPLLRAPY